MRHVRVTLAAASLCAVSFFLSLAPVAAAEPGAGTPLEAREWKFRTGGKIPDGQLVGVYKDERARILLKDKRVQLLKIDTLSDEDQAYIKDNAKKLHYFTLSPKGQEVYRQIHAPEEALMARLNKALASNDYDELEKIAAENRAKSGPCQYQERYSHLSTFYQRMAASPEVNEEFFKKWMAVRGKSITPYVAAATYHNYQGWAIRGQGFSSTVTEESGRQFVEEIRKAWDIIEKTEDIAGDDVERYRIKIEVGMSIGWDRTQVDDMSALLLTKCPKYFPAHTSMALLLTPRWGGDEGAMEAYAADVADDVGGDDGDELYGQIIHKLWSFHSSEGIFKITKFDYDRGMKGLDLIISRHPPSVQVLNVAAHLSSQMKDLKRSEAYFARLAELGEYWSPGVFTSQYGFQRGQELVWHLGRGDKREHLLNTGGVKYVRFLPDNKHVVAVGMGLLASDRCAVWKIDDKDPHQAFTHVSGQYFGGNPHQLFVSADGKRIMLSGENGHGRGQVLQCTQIGQNWTFIPITLDLPCQEAFAESRDAAWQARTAAKGGVQILSKKGAGTSTVQTRSPHRALAFALDGKALVIGCEDGSLVWVTGDKLDKPAQPLAVARGPITQLAFSADGKTLLAASASGSMYVIDPAARKALGELKGDGALLDAALSADGRWAASAHEGSDKVVLWDVAGRKELKQLAGHVAGVTSVSFAGDNRWLASGSLDGGVRLWDVPAALAGK